MTAEHIALIVGLITMLVILVTTTGFRVLKKILPGAKRDSLMQFLNSLDRIHLLPALWILAAVSVGYWLVARAVISYS